DVFVDQGRDGVERVEQEMRVELHFEQVQLGLGQPRLQSGRLQLAVAELAMIVQGVTDADHRPVNQHIGMELAVESHAQKAKERQTVRVRTIERLDDRIVQEHLDASKENRSE